MLSLSFGYSPSSPPEVLVRRIDAFKFVLQTQQAIFVTRAWRLRVDAEPSRRIHCCAMRASAGKSRAMRAVRSENSQPCAVRAYGVACSKLCDGLLFIAHSGFLRLSLLTALLLSVRGATAPFPVPPPAPQACPVAPTLPPASTRRAPADRFARPLVPPACGPWRLSSLLQRGKSELQPRPPALPFGRVALPAPRFAFVNCHPSSFNPPKRPRPAVTPARNYHGQEPLVRTHQTR